MDYPLVESLQTLMTDWLPFWKAITALGGATFMLVLGILVYTVWQPEIGARFVGFMLLVANLGGDLKELLMQPRPFWVDADITPHAGGHNFGMPSGHALQSMTAWGLLASESRRWHVWLAAGLLIFLIGTSRLVLGVHSAWQVLAGWSLGALLLFGLLYWWETLRGYWLTRDTRRVRLALYIPVIFLIANAAIVTFNDLTNWQVPGAWLALNEARAFDPESHIRAYDPRSASFLLGMFGGFMVACLMLFRKGWLAYPSHWGKAAGRFLVTALGMTALIAGSNSLLPGDFLVTFWGSLALLILAALGGLWIGYWAPLLFIRLNWATHKNT